MIPKDPVMLLSYINTQLNISAGSRIVIDVENDELVAHEKYVE